MLPFILVYAQEGGGGSSGAGTSGGGSTGAGGVGGGSKTSGYQAKSGYQRTVATNGSRSNWGWLGLLGLIGLANLYRKSKYVEPVTESEDVLNASSSSQ